MRKKIIKEEIKSIPICVQQGIINYNYKR